MKIFSIFFITLTIFNVKIESLQNGLARLPPMGWLSWVAFGCETDCDSHPDKCLSEKQIQAMADRVASDGYKDAGYQFVIIDDCWLARTRDENDRLQSDPVRFSSGIKNLAKYVHDKDLKFGIYEDYGNTTCAGYPGTLNHVDIDADTFASWDVDYVKLDGCFIYNVTDMDQGFQNFRDALKKTGRDIVYSCEWPLYTQMYQGIMPDYNQVSQTCNVWRNYWDIESAWWTILRTIDYFDDNQDALAQYTGPGGWNDPDMLVIGNAGVSVDQAKAQFAIWSIWSAPLLMSTDLRYIADEMKSILLNRGVIAIDQDPLGIMGKVVVKTPSVSIYTKPVTPVDNSTQDHSYALAFLNRDDCKQANVTVVRLEQLGLTHANGYIVENLYDNEVIVGLKPSDSFNTIVPPTGVTMYKATVIA